MKTWPVMSSAFPVSENVARMQSSATMAAMQVAENLRATGANVCDFGAGEPDFDTPDNIKQAAERAMRAGRTKYTANAGIRELQRAIIDFYQKEFGTEYQPSEVMATAGGKQAIFNAVVTVNQVERAITPRTKLLILNSPSNPSGRVLPPHEFRRIMELTTERGIYVVSDECYLRFVYPPGEVFSAASLPAELRSRLCIAGSFSKTYAMTGWRVGYALAPAEWTKAMLKVQGHSTSNTNTIAQWAAVEALTGPQESVGIMLKEYTARRAWLLNALREIPGFKCNEPEGAFYAFPDVRGCLKKDLKTSGDFAQRLLEEEHTVVTDGAGFGAEGFIRISYATSMERIKEGIERIRRFAQRHF